MKNLLKNNEVRQLELVEYLTEKYNWAQISDISETLGYPERTLKDDLSYLKDSFDYLTIETSYDGIHLTFDQQTNLNSFYQSLFEESTIFQLLEFLITKETVESDWLLEKLSISLSTLYRLINQINDVLTQNFRIEILPNDLIFSGKESDIRYFYYIYFSERIPQFHWEFHLLNDKELHILLQTFIQTSGFPMSYTSYMAYKTIIAVNLFRYRQNHKMPIGSEDLTTDYAYNAKELEPVEKKLGIIFNQESINQLFYNFIHTDYVKDYNELKQKMNENKSMKENISNLEHSLKQLAKKYKLPLKNKNRLLLSLVNASNCEQYTPHSGYLLYNRIPKTTREFQQNFPDFSKEVIEILEEYRKTVDKPITKFTKDYLFYILFVEWRDLIYELQQTKYKLKVLVVSDYSHSHAYLLKQSIELSFPLELEVETVNSLYDITEDIQSTSYDIFIANFPLSDENHPFKISVEDTLTIKDVFKIRKAIRHFYRSNDIKNYFIRE